MTVIQRLDGLNRERWALEKALVGLALMAPAAASGLAWLAVAVGLGAAGSWMHRSVRATLLRGARRLLLRFGGDVTRCRVGRRDSGNRGVE